MNLQSKYVQDENGVKFAPISTPNAIRWPDGSNLNDKLGDHEEALITVTLASDVPQGTTVEGLVINVYYNDGQSPYTTLTTDSQGVASIRVPMGYKYRLAFPPQTGCETPWDEVHTAMLYQRSVEVEYEEAAPAPLTEEVKVVLKNTAGQLQTGKTVTCTVGSTQEQQVTDSNGEASFTVEFGSAYTITAPSIEGYYIRGNDYTVGYTADRNSRVVAYIYRIFVSGVFVVTSDGGEYTLEQFQTGVESGTLQKSDALLVKIATQALQDAGGVFSIKIADIAVNSLTNKAWANNTAYKFTSIPTDGNSATARYYYDGKTASALIQAEGDGQGIDTPAVDYALAQSVTVDNVPYGGFLGSIGQWGVAWSARDVIDDIIQYLNSSWRKMANLASTNKWSSTQYTATGAWSWTSSAYGGNTRYGALAVVPFFAY